MVATLQCLQKIMTDKEFKKLLDDDSQSDAEVSRQRRKRKTRDMVCPFFMSIPWIEIIVYYSSFKV